MITNLILGKKLKQALEENKKHRIEFMDAIRNFDRCCQKGKEEKKSNNIDFKKGFSFAK